MAIIQSNSVPNMGGELVHVSLPRTWKGDGTVPCVVLAEGYPNGPEVNFNTFQLQPVIKAVTDAGFPVINSQLGGNQFGSTLAQNRITAALAHMRDKYGAHPGRVNFAGFSMGSMNSLSWVGNNASQVGYVHLWCPIPDQAYISNNPNYSAAFNAAYGGNWTEAEYGATHNPITMANAGKYDDVKIRLEYANDDDVTPPSFATAFAGAVGSPNTVAVSLGLGGHQYTQTYKPASLSSLISNLRATI